MCLTGDGLELSAQLGRAKQRVYTCYWNIIRIFKATTPIQAAAQKMGALVNKEYGLPETMAAFLGFW